MKLLRWMLKAFPLRFRERFGTDLAQAHEDRLREASAARRRVGLHFWVGTAWDLLATAFLERVGQWRHRLPHAPRGRGSPGVGVVREMMFALRGLARRPGYAATAVLTLGLGIGGVAAMVSVTSDVLLAPLPYDHDDEIVVLWNNGKTARPTFDTRWPVSFDQVEGFQRNSVTARASSWVSRRQDATLDMEGALEQVPFGLAAWNLFDFLGVEAQAGRLFTASDAGDGAAVVVVSDAAWRRRFGADPAIVGRSVTIHGRARTILGVLPADFRWFLREDNTAAEFWIPEPSDDRSSFYSYWLLARPAAGATLEAMRMEFAPLAWEFFTNPGYKETFTVADAASADHLRPYILGDVAQRIPILLTAVGLVLLLASMSVAHLVLGRVGSREGEFALRRALGGSRRRVAWMVCAETAAVVVLGGAVGVLLADWGLGILRAAAPPGIPRLDSVTLNPVVLAVVTGITASVLLLVSVVPAWFATRVDPGAVIGGQGRGIGSRTARTRQLMIASQVTAAVFLLVGSSLVLRSWYALLTEELGLETSGVLTARFQIPADRWEDSGLRAPSSTRPEGSPIQRGTAALFAGLDRLEADLAAIPGVDVVALARTVPLSGTYGWWSPVRIEGWEDRAWEELVHGTSANWVTPRYFDALGITPLRGRLLTADDARQGAPTVTVVSESFAAQFWPGEDPIGKRFYNYDGVVFDDGRPSGGSHLVEVVGVVPAVRELSVQESNVTVFLPFRRPLRFNTQPQRGASLILKTNVPPASVASQVRAAASRVFPTVPLEDVASMETVAGSWLREPTFFAYIMTLFGGYGLLLSLVGIVGVVSFQVSRRTREVGVRLALGAQSRDILGLFGRETGIFVAVGLVAGLGGAIMASRFLEAWLYEVGRLDPATFVGVPLLFVVAAMLATWLPARRALDLDPVETLRDA